MSDTHRSAAILLVDDEPTILVSLKQFLEMHGFEIHLAESAESALRVLAEQPLDMVISDYKLPGMSGDALLRKVRDSWPNMVRVMISGYAEMDVVITALNEGVIHRFLAKPFNPTELLISVRNLMATRETPPAPAPPHAPNILLVDDSKYFRTLLTRLLQSKYAVSAVEDGIQAINQARLTSPDLVITGLTLFGVNGLNFIQFLRLGLHLSCPIIVWDFLLDAEAKSSLESEVSLFLRKDEAQIDAVMRGVSQLLG